MASGGVPMPTLLCIIGLSLLWASVDAIKASRPHILFILADDYGWNDIGYHNSSIPTPTLDRLAASGVKLENYYVQPVCTPARAALMTGRYPIRYGLQHDVIHPPQPAGLFLNETTIADRMREAGYATHAIGKWHLGFYKWDYTPTFRGFDTHVGYLNGAEDYYSHNASWVYNGYDLRNNTENYISAAGIYSSSVFEKEVFRIIDQYTTTPAQDQKPLFIYLAMQTCHQPLEVPAEYLTQCNEIGDKSRRTYCGMTINMDATIANVTQALAEAGLLEDTLIVFSTDNGGLPVQHGGASNWPLRGGKFTLYEGGVKGVGFVTGAGVPSQAQGSVYNGLMHITDWFPTLLGVAGGNTNNTFPLDGVDQWAHITMPGKNLSPSPRTEILHNIDDASNTSALRSGDWKIVVGKQQYDGWYHPAGAKHFVETRFEKPHNISLFNVIEDPLEKHDKADKHPDIVKQLLSKIEQYRTGMVPNWNPPNDPASNPDLFGGFWGPWVN